ncbi:MAG TPA: phosphoglucomutase [Methanoregulaceae archaeon]|nr:phosphoglucomutase [Methanoregulaceae archaeon]
MTIFKAYDVRGVYGTELSEAEARTIGRAYGTALAGGTATVGRDTRTSGPALEAAFLEGVLSTGARVEEYGVLPIAVISFVTWQDRLAGSAYISASHNPPEYNGIRFRTGDGYGLLYQESPIMEAYRSGAFASGKGELVGRSADEAIDRYGVFVADRVTLDRPLRVVLDMGNGSAGEMGRVFREAGCEPIVRYGEMDGTFPGRGPRPTEASLASSAKAVVAEGADFGVGFDPDADRGIAIDDRGRVLAPEKVAIILATRRYRPGDLVISGFDCSMVLEERLLPLGFRIERERVGDVFIANRVKNDGAVLGVERSGHFFLPEFQYSDDPFAMALALAEVIAGGDRLSDLADAIPDFPYVEHSIPLTAPAADVMARLAMRLARLEPDTTDGLKVTTEDYAVLVRPSNTEPMIRVYAETRRGDVNAVLREYEAHVIAAMQG